MRKCAWLVIVTLLITVLSVPVLAADDVVTANSTGYNDVPFSNGYNGFCLDKWLDIAYEEDGFVVSEASEATNNGSGESISQYLKILFVDFFDTVFEKKDGEYKVKNATMTQATVYGFTDSASKDWDYEPLTSVVAKYDEGRRVKDHGETIVVGDDKITFDFIVLKSQKEGQQDFFAYKLTVEKNVYKHNPSTPNCVTPSKCTECGEELSGVDPNTHTGNIEIKDKVDPEGATPGYSGDTYCKDCKKLVKKGVVIYAEPTPTATPAPTSAATAEPTVEPTAKPTAELNGGLGGIMRPEDTPMMGVEPTPGVTFNPSVTTAPDSMSAPDVTPVPGTTSNPDATVAPETTFNPEITPSVDITPEPEDIAEQPDGEEAGAKDDPGIKNEIPPQTGDKGYQGWIVIMVLSMACIIVLARRSKATE